MDNFLIRKLSKFYNFVIGRGAPSIEKDMGEILELLQACADAKGGEVSARMRAAEMVRYYIVMDEPGRLELMKIITSHFGPDPDAVRTASNNFLDSIGTPAQWDAEAKLRTAVESPRQKILTQFNTINMGVKFLVDLRADLLGYLKDNPELIALERDLLQCLTSWFDVGFLELVRLTWDSPASVLEKLIAYEAVHEVGSWNDLKNRLDSDRRVYAFFHPRMPTEPLIFVQVALVPEMTGSVQELLDVEAPLLDAEQASTAIFYSITNTQAGLRGISFGNFLLKRVIDSLQRDFPKLKTFATLSPLPGFAGWLKQEPEILRKALSSTDHKALAEAGYTQKDLDAVLESPCSVDLRLLDMLSEALLRTAAYYLLKAKRKGKPLDAVARFHLGNGARIERLNWMADSAPKGVCQALGIMVNYRYLPERLEENIEGYAAEGRIDAVPQIVKMAAFTDL